MQTTSDPKEDGEITMFSIQESINKTEDQRKTVQEFMDTNGYFDSQECNLYTGLKRSTQRELYETLRKLTLHEMLFTPGGYTTGSAGLAGVQYLVPTWLSQKLYAASRPVDIVPLISEDIFEPRGGECTVPVGKLNAFPVGEGGQPTTGYTGHGAEISLKKLVVPSIVTEEMIEDNQFGLVEWHFQHAGESMAYQAADLALDVLKTATDGVGTVNSAATGDADETKFTGGATSDMITAFREVGNDEFIANTVVTTPEAWGHSLSVQALPAGWTNMAAPEGFNIRIGQLDFIFSTSKELHDTADDVGLAFTECITVVFDRRNALITARKNWLRIDNYSDPVKDLAGAMITGRQDSVTNFNNSIYRLTET